MKPTDNLEEFKTEVREAVENLLCEELSGWADSHVRNAAEYVLVGGGHRWRAMFVVAAGRIFDANALSITLPFAAAVELAHTASLILDDLPSMDDANIRRGRPCVHLQFSDWAVDLLPVCLVNLAFKLSLENKLASADRLVASTHELSRAGSQMIAGQELDLLLSKANESDSDLLESYRGKSGALYAAAAKAGAILCGASESECLALERCGMHWGLSYQVHDDIADVIAADSQIGKQTGQDQDKPTAVSLHGFPAAEKLAKQFADAALAELEPFDSSADLLRDFVQTASWSLVKT